MKLFFIKIYKLFIFLFNFQGKKLWSMTKCCDFFLLNIIVIYLAPIFAYMNASPLAHLYRLKGENFEQKKMG